jgi:hypothetical protein
METWSLRSGTIYGHVPALIRLHPLTPPHFQKVLDFGYSRMLEHGQNIKTKSYGTITHTPPELLLEGTLSKAADVRKYNMIVPPLPFHTVLIIIQVYAFGIIIWELYMGSRPFAGMTQGQVRPQSVGV